MTKDEINRRIAEACGWIKCPNCPNCSYWYAPGSDTSSSAAGVELPDYCNDLNAMHEAEKMLNTSKETFSRWCDYWDNLPILHATAAQHAEAFLHTLGKWEGGGV